MLTTVELNGFKSFYSETIDLNRLTVLTGLNSSGKSSVIQALRMIDRLCRKHSVLLPGYGDYKELKNQHYSDPMTIRVSDDAGNIFEIGEHPKDINGGTYPQLLYISASRFGPQVSIPMFANDDEPDELGQNVVKSIDNHRDDIMNPILKREDTEGNTFGYVLASWLNIISPSMKFDYEILQKADSSYITFNGHRSKNVGFGLSYTLPVIASLLLGTVKKNSIVIIENPEAHLHAKAQTEMAFLIALCVEAGAQVIIETHSDHLFDGLRIFVKEHPGFEKKMNCFWFELDEMGNTNTEEIIVNDKGRIVNLDIPLHFMDQFEYNSNRILFDRQ